MKALSFRGGAAGAKVILLICTALPKTSISKKFKTNKIGSRATHEINWYEDKILIYESSNITKPEEVTKHRLSKFKANDMNITVEQTFTSPKAPLIVIENEPCENQVQQQQSHESSKTAIFTAVL